MSVGVKTSVKSDVPGTGVERFAEAEGGLGMSNSSGIVDSRLARQ